MNNSETSPAEPNKSAQRKRRANSLRQRRAMQVTGIAITLAGVAALAASGGGFGLKAAAAASTRPVVCTDLTGGAKVA